MNCNLAKRLFVPVLEGVSLTFVILLGGCSGANVSTFPAPVSPSPSVELAPSSQFSQTDLAFIADIEAFARNNGTTFSDATPEQNVETARTICTAVENNGASTAIENYFQAILVQFPNLTEGEQSALGYMFSTSVKYYCPQYLADVRNFLVSQGF